MKKAKKVFLKILAAILAIIFAVCAVCGIYYAASRSCTLTVKVDTKSPLRDFTAGEHPIAGGPII